MKIKNTTVKKIIITSIIILIIIGIISLAIFLTNNSQKEQNNNIKDNNTINQNKFNNNTNNQNNNKTTKKAEIKLTPPDNNKIYFGAFPNFGGPEDNVSKERIIQFEKIAKKNITWAYFSNNWNEGIKYPKNSIHQINDLGIIPFVRLMPRSNFEEYQKEEKYSLIKIINGEFDKEIKQWAKDAKKDNIPLLIDFAVEMNGNWFSWSGVNYNNKTYSDKKYSTGPEIYRDAYRHIINIFRDEDVSHVTWFFHPDIYSNPDEEWNQPKYYYPGDDYIDWIGVSIYGPLNPEENYWESFSEILSKRYKIIKEISSKKPLALLEFGVTDNHPLGNKAEWLNDAFETISQEKYLDFKAISYWDETWEEKDNLFATISINSSQESLKTFQKNIANNKFISEGKFSNNKFQLNNKITNNTNNYTNNQTTNKTTLKLTNQTNNEENNNQTNKTNWFVPKPQSTWQWQLSGKINTNYSVEIYDVDLFETPKEIIDELHNKGIKIICYFNAGAWEPYRNDSKEFPKEVIGKTMEGWEDEKWLDISKFNLFSNIIKKRFDLAVEKKCDGIEPDNIYGYTNKNGFDLTYEDQIKYNKWLSEEAHKRNLSIALKNDLEQVKDLVDYFDFAINEQCFQYNECEILKLFIEKNKAVLGVEYELEPKEFCDKAKELKFSWLKMNYELNGTRISCE